MCDPLLTLLFRLSTFRVQLEVSVDALRQELASTEEELGSTKQSVESLQHQLQVKRAHTHTPHTTVSLLAVFYLFLPLLTSHLCMFSLAHFNFWLVLPQDLQHKEEEVVNHNQQLEQQTSQLRDELSAVTNEFQELQQKWQDQEQDKGALQAELERLRQGK